LIPNPIRKALSSIRMSGVRSLLMGGQACVLYGAAEFSRDLDLCVLAEPENLESLVRVVSPFRTRPGERSRRPLPLPL
jgi:hypothetical protein